MEINKIYQGNCFEILKTFTDNSIDCIVTSPPYWSLRSYSTHPQIWDGNNCEHQWGENILPRGAKSGMPSDKSCMAAKQIKGQNDIRKTEGTNFCIHCGAWKGELGNEPSFQFFIKHLCDIFDEIKRVLKPTGTCWVNLGDSYAGSGNGTNDYRTEKSKSLNGVGKYANKEYQGTGTARLNAKEKYHNQARYEPRAKTNEVQAKSLCQIPSRFAIEMTNRGWILRNEIIWYKRNCMPASVTDRFTVDFEKIFFFTKSQKYFFEQQFEPYKELSVERLQRGISENHKYSDGADGQTKQGLFKARKNIMPPIGGVKHLENGNPVYSGNQPEWSEKGRNKRCVWDITTGGGTADAHFATYPQELTETPIKAGCPENGIVLDPFFGSGTTGIYARKAGRNYIGIELNKNYIDIANKRLYKELGMFP